jgi:hypothetical protein
MGKKDDEWCIGATFSAGWPTPQPTKLNAASTPHAGNETPAAFVETGGCLRSERMAAFDPTPRPQSRNAHIGKLHPLQERASHSFRGSLGLLR